MLEDWCGRVLSLIHDLIPSVELRCGSWPETASRDVGNTVADNVVWKI